MSKRPQCCVTKMSMGTHEEVVVIMAGGEELYAQPAAVKNKLGVKNLLSLPGATKDTSVLAESRPPRVACVLDFGVMIDEIGVDEARKRYSHVLPPKVHQEIFG